MTLQGQVLLQKESRDATLEQQAASAHESPSPHAITRARCQRRECVLERRAVMPSSKPAHLKTEFNGIGEVADLHQHRADGRHLKDGQSNARGSSPYRRWRRSDCACSGLFALGAAGTQMSPPKVARCSPTAPMIPPLPALPERLFVTFLKLSFSGPPPVA
jgi:hypothetical protein